MTSDLENRLTNQLGSVAQGAGPMTLELAAVTHRIGQRQRRRVRLRMVGGAGLAAMVGVGLFALRPGSTPKATPAGGAEVQAERIESPLVVEQGALMHSSIVKPGAVAIELPDGQRLSFGIVGGPHFDGYRQYACVLVGAESTCRVQPSELDVETTPESGLAGTDNVAYWTRVPPATDVVEFFADGKIRWQHPVAGIAAFPVDAHLASDTMVAFDALGAELSRVSWARTRSAGETIWNDPDGTVRTHRLYTSLDDPVAPAVDINLVENLTQAEEDSYRQFADTTMLSCLSAQGDAAWTTCIQSTDAAVKSYLLALYEASSPEPG